MSKSKNEAFSRILIDKALEFSGWDLLDPKQVVFELHSGAGRADYLLKDKLGRTLCVLEAKRENLDPYDAKEQARGYAENLNAPFGSISREEHWTKPRYCSHRLRCRKRFLNASRNSKR